MVSKRKQETTRHFLRLVCIVAALLATEILAPLPADAKRNREEDLSNYFGLKAGLYMPTASDMDQSLAGEIVLGHKFSRFFGMEVAAGYTKTKSEVTTFNFSTFTSTTTQRDIKVIPLTLGFKGFIPVKSFEPFFGGGIGYYITDVSSSSGASEGDNIFGYFFTGGLNYRVAEGIMLGAEIRYVVANFATTFAASGTTTSGSVDVTLDGLVTTLNLEFRF